jgi:phosphatidylethanolamine-binding protein (PEBP) family uncharacterized protein
MQLFSKLALVLTFSSLCTSFSVSDQKPIAESKDAFDTIRKDLKKADIIGQVVDDFQPKCFVAPFYGKKQKSVAYGNKFKQSKTKHKPTVQIYCPNMKSTPGLTLALTDPDAPSRDNPKWGEMCHWITIAYANGTSTPEDVELEIELDLTDCADLIDYKPPGPPPKTGYHRYIFVLLEGLTTNLTIPEDRQHWGTGQKGHGVRDWAEKEDLKVVGANYFVEKNKKQ